MVVVAPALRMLVTHAWAVVHQNVVDMSWGSLTRPYWTKGSLAKTDASLDQKSANAAASTLEEPTTSPRHAAPPAPPWAFACHGSTITVIPESVARPTTRSRSAKYAAYPAPTPGNGPPSSAWRRSQETSSRRTPIPVSR